MKNDADSRHYTDLLCKSVDWFLYDNGLRHERVKICKVNVNEM